MQQKDKELIREQYKKLVEEESLLLAAIGSISGIVPAAIIFYVLTSAGLIPLILTVVPGIVIGFCAKYSGGKIFTFKAKLIPSFVAFGTTIASGILLNFYLPIFLMSLPNAITAYWLSKRKLSKSEELVKYNVERGLV